jgi:hypothetical protein
MNEIKAFGFISALLLVSTVVSPMLIDTSRQTYVYEFYVQGSKIPPHQVQERSNYEIIKLGDQIQIVAIHATISALPDVHVQIWLEIQGMTKFYHVNSGSLGTANCDLSGIRVLVPANRDIALSYWSHNMGAVEQDFHGSITIFYET